MLDPLMLSPTHVVQPCSLLKVFNTLRSVEESLDIRLVNHKHSIIVEGALLVIDMLME